jgi:hypothetical protein
MLAACSSFTESSTCRYRRKRREARGGVQALLHTRQTERVQELKRSSINNSPTSKTTHKDTKLSVVSRMSSEDDDDDDNNSNNNIKLIHKPIDADVLCGRGRAIRSHPGNQLYITLIQDKKTEYSDAAKGWKQEIVRKVVDAIRDQKGRFLQRQGNYWMDIGEPKALAKTAQAFRDFKSEDEEGFNSNSNSNNSNGVAVKRKMPSHDVVTTATNKKSKGVPSFLSRFGGGRKPKLAAHSHNFDPSPSSSEEEESDQSKQQSPGDDDSSESSSDDDGDGGGGDVSETETEDSFPVYRRR